ncbi:MAG TPA: phosphomannomutase/phosphoglucomutase [Clostridiales bacterium]|nr:phosphomannomutase/phosphoglucomutase [Clostridiales bacterium]
MTDYMHLKSGTDIRGVASDIFGLQIELTDEAIYDITSGFADWLVSKICKRDSQINVAVGHDSRISAGRIKQSVIKALADWGFNVYDCGLCSTPAMFMATVLKNMDASVQITASHHPADRNGLKFFTKEGGLDSPDIVEVLRNAAKKRAVAGNGMVHKFNFMPEYAKFLRDIICKELGCSEDSKPLSGLKIIVDASNGAGGFYVNDVLKPLGADTTGSQFLEPDGMFPNHKPNPEDKSAMESISHATVRASADLGIIFDTDVDRAGCVDKNGNEINRNRLIALAAAIALESIPGGTIVTDSVTSDGLKIYIEQELGGVHYRYRRGYRNVINKAIELCNNGINCPLAIETSGHAAFRENYFLDDGAYLITKIIIKLVKLRSSGLELEDLIGKLQQPAEESEIRFKINHEDFKSYGLNVIGELEEFAKAKAGWKIADDNREGIRVSVGNGYGWFLLRMSVHDPILPLNIESNLVGGVKEIAKSLVEFFAKFDQLDITPLLKVAE